MKPKKKCMTFDLIRTNLADDVVIKPCLFGGWKARFPCGVVARITKYRLGRVKRKKASHDDFEQVVFDVCSLSQEVWGGIGIYGGASTKDTEAFIQYCEAYEFDVYDNPYCPFSKQRREKYFPGATVKRDWTYGAWRITLPNGSGAIIGGDKVFEVWGDGDVYRAALQMVNDVYGHAVAAGSKENILAGIAHGKALEGVEVIPELYTSNKVYERVGSVCGILFGIPGVIYGVVTDSVGHGLVYGLIAAYIANFLYCVFFLRNSRDKARQRGQALKGAFPAIHGASASRKASMDQARDRGMLP